MAKPAKAAPAAPVAEKKKPTPPAPEQYKFGVTELAEALGIEPTSVRVKLRNAEIEKAGRSYGWNTQKDFDAVVKQLKSTAKAKDEPAPAPAPATKPKRPAKA